MSEEQPLLSIDEIHLLCWLRLQDYTFDVIAKAMSYRAMLSQCNVLENGGIDAKFNEQPTPGELKTTPMLSNILEHIKHPQNQPYFEVWQYWRSLHTFYRGDTKKYDKVTVHSEFKFLPEEMEALVKVAQKGDIEGLGGDDEYLKKVATKYKEWKSELERFWLGFHDPTAWKAQQGGQ